ncbi:hypothetical protein IU483_18720 [Streptomyces gardneri]|nr:hypothetical protein [Streptomyces gardneri]
MTLQAIEAARRRALLMAGRRAWHPNATAPMARLIEHVQEDGYHAENPQHPHCGEHHRWSAIQCPNLPSEYPFDGHVDADSRAEASGRRRVQMMEPMRLGLVVGRPLLLFDVDAVRLGPLILRAPGRLLRRCLPKQRRDGADPVGPDQTGDPGGRYGFRQPDRWLVSE